MTRCREGAVAEPLAGTAPLAQQWWLIEMPGSWSGRALEQCRVASVRTLTSDASRRLLLIRRPGRHPAVDAGAPLRIWLASGSGGVLVGVSVVPERLHELAHRWDPCRQDPGQWDPGQWHPAGASQVDAGDLADDSFTRLDRREAPRMLVCTNAARDACCGIEGRALLTSLGDHPGVWECSHLGGHRFAPTALHVDQGMAYGRLTAQAGARLLEDDQVSPAHTGLMRGRPSLSPPLQAAQIEILRRTGRMPDWLALDDDGSATYRCGTDGGRVELSLTPVAPRRPSCGAEPKEASSWQARGLSPA